MLFAASDRHARVEGKAGYGGSKKTARQAAALSLRAALTGLAVPEDDDPPAVPGDFPDDPGLSPADLESWLDYEVARPSPDPELATAVRPGKLTARSVYLLLFEADPRGWTGARAAAWEALVSTPMMAGGVLSMYSRARGWPTARYIKTGERSALAFLPAPDGLVVGAPAAPPPRRPCGQARPWRCCVISLLPHGHRPGIPNGPRLTAVPSPFSTSGRRPVSSRTCPTSTTPAARRTRRCSPARPAARTRQEATHAPPRAAPRTRRRRRPPPGCWTRSPNRNGPPPRSSPGRRKRRHAVRGASSGGCCGSAARWTSVTGGSRSPARRVRRLRDRSRVHGAAA